MGLEKVRMGGDTPIAVVTVNSSLCCIKNRLPGPVLFLVILFPMSMDIIILLSNVVTFEAYKYDSLFVYIP